MITELTGVAATAAIKNKNARGPEKSPHGDNIAASLKYASQAFERAVTFISRDTPKDIERAAMILQNIKAGIDGIADMWNAPDPTTYRTIFRDVNDPKPRFGSKPLDIKHAYKPGEKVTLNSGLSTYDNWEAEVIETTIDHDRKLRVVAVNVIKGPIPFVIGDYIHNNPALA